MTTHTDLSRLLTPQSIAIIGASSNNTSISGQPLRLMIDAGYAGKIYPVNPKRDEVQGIKAYPDAQSIPGPCDVALVAGVRSLTGAVPLPGEGCRRRWCFLRATSGRC